MAEEGEGEGEMIVAGKADAEEETDGGWGGGGGGDGEKCRSGGRFLLPPGYRFAPSDDELVRYYLLPKLQGREHVPNEAIIVDDVYECHPDQLIRKYRDLGQGKSWYFLSPRERKYGDGDRPRRDTKDGCGRWKASTGKKKKKKGSDSADDIDNDGQPSSSPWEEQKVAGDGTTIYCESVLAYFEGPRARQNKSKWLMQELTIPEYEIKLPKKGGNGGKMLDRYVMCKIYLAPSHRDEWNDDEEAGPSSAAPQPMPVESGDGTAVELPKLSKKLAGKRPAEDQQLQNVAAGKKRARHSNRLRLGAPAPAPPLQNNGVQAPFRTPEYYGQPMGYRARAPVPCPSAAFNGQVRAPRQPAAYDDWVPAMTRRMVGYSGQMPVTSNGQVRRPPYRPAGTPNNHGQNRTMMTRPSCPAGQALSPPSAVLEKQKQKQTETDEMLEKRVLQQNLEEHLRMQSGDTHATQQEQQQQAMALAFMMLHQQQQYHPQSPYLGANSDYHDHDHHAGGMAMAPRFSLEDFYASEAAQQYEHSRVVLPATSSSASAGEAVTVMAEGSPVSTVVSVEGNGEGNDGDCGNHDQEEWAVAKVSPGEASASAQ